MTTSGHATGARACSRCGANGRSVKPITLRSLVRPGALLDLGEAGGFHYCATPTCQVAYYRPSTGSSILKDELCVRIGEKETARPRTVCYCFNHTVEEIEAEVAATGQSRVPNEIAEKCRQGLDRCEETNPQGACCLGNVRRFVREAQAGRELASASAADHRADCCSPAATAEPKPRASTGAWATSSALVTAALSSACCGLPLLLVAFGASAAGVSGFFERYRPHLLVATALLLASGFYLVYFRSTRCAPGSSCAVPKPRLLRLNKAMLWVATAVVVAFAAFPRYVGYLLGGRTGDATEIPSGARVATVEVKGMSCAGCARTLETALQGVPGVLAAAVDFDATRASLTFLPGTDLAPALAAISEQGFEGQVLDWPANPVSANPNHQGE